MKKIVFIGGDTRFVYAAKYMSECYECAIMGFSRETAAGIPEAAGAYDIAVLPVIRDNIRCPDTNKSYDISILTSLLKPGGTVITGAVTEEIKKLCREHSFALNCYLDREDFSISNAVLTAEGAVSIAINETPFSVHDSNVLILGFGRIGKICARYFSELGARVSAAARKKGAIAGIAAYGCIPVDLTDEEDVLNALSNADIIINTVPAPVLTGKRGEAVKKAVLIELASIPCTDKECKIRIVKANGLPGKTAPVTAGKIIAQTVHNILCEGGVSNEVA